jgi:hypothetical protein
MNIDNMINISFKCLKAIRHSEMQNNYPESALRRLEEADIYLRMLKLESPLMHSLLEIEYVNALKKYDVGLNIK